MSLTVSGAGVTTPILALLSIGIAETENGGFSDLWSEHLADNCAFAQHNDAIADAELLELRGDHQHCVTLLGEVTSDPVNLLSRTDVDATCRLVQDQYLEVEA